MNIVEKKSDFGFHWLYFAEGADLERDDFICQYNTETRVMLNFWGTIKVQLGTTADVLAVAQKMAAFEKTVEEFLA